MKRSVTVVDYGIGNLLSVRRAFEACGTDVQVTDRATDIDRAERLVLPGVGAFAIGMRGLRERGLVESVRQFGFSGRPLLGICLGMQLLAARSEEFGDHEGLGLVPGRVVAIPSTGSDGRPHKIPHIGWTRLVRPQGPGSWDNSILSDLAEGSYVYVVHSFTVVPDHQGHRLADCYYDGRMIAGAVRNGSIYGCQFHPEKSGAVGLSIVRQFCLLP